MVVMAIFPTLCFFHPCICDSHKNRVFHNYCVRFFIFFFPTDYSNFLVVSIIIIVNGGKLKKFKGKLWELFMMFSLQFELKMVHASG